MRGSGGQHDEREEFRAVHAIRDALPTRRHAEMLFDMAVNLLGKEAWIESWNQGALRLLFRREETGSPFLVPWPVLTMTRGGREGPSPLPTGIPGVYEEPPRRPGPAPRLRDLGPGEIKIHDGPHGATITYGADGRWFECTRSASPKAHRGVIPALKAKAGPPVELVADYVAALDPGRHGPGRVHLPVPVPGGARGVWTCGLYAIREALFTAGGSTTPGFHAADGWLGRALAGGVTREAALEAWRTDVARVRPFPTRPKPPPELPPEPSMEHFATENGFVMRGTLRGPSSDVPWVEPTVENTPAAVLPVEGPPETPPPFGRWTMLMGGFGKPVPAALDWEPEGFTLIGDRLLDRLDLKELEERLAAADDLVSEGPARHSLPDLEAPPADIRVRTYHLADPLTGAPLDRPSITSHWGKRFHARELDGDRLRWSVVRMRPVTD